MAIDKRKLDTLIDYVDRWLSHSKVRNLQMLARYTGISYPTLRRIMQRESTPELETSLSIMNTVATYEETIQLFSDNTAIQEFYKRVASAATVAENGLTLRINSRDTFWIVMLSLTVGATKDRVEKFCGLLGLAEFEKLIEENILVESGEIFRLNSEANVLFIENKRLNGEAVEYITEAAVSQDSSLKLWMCYNVTAADADKILEKYRQTHFECDEIARKSEGNILFSAAMVGTKAYEVHS